LKKQKIQEDEERRIREEAEAEKAEAEGGEDTTEAAEGESMWFFLSFLSFPLFVVISFPLQKRLISGRLFIAMRNPLVA
jgi:hypothetical protein